MPSIDSNPGIPGSQTRSTVRVQVTNAQANLTVASFSTVDVTVARATPVIATTASPSVAVGGTISDSAAATAVSVGSPTAPTGTVNFQVFGPDNSACTGVPLGQSTNPLRMPVPKLPRTASTDSDAFTVTAPGVYRFVAAYGGDANFNPVTSPCNAPNESVVVTAAPPPTVVVGAAFYIDGTSARAGRSGARVSVFATGAEPGFSYILGRCRDCHRRPPPVDLTQEIAGTGNRHHLVEQSSEVAAVAFGYLDSARAYGFGDG